MSVVAFRLPQQNQKVTLVVKRRLFLAQHMRNVPESCLFSFQSALVVDEGNIPLTYHVINLAKVRGV